MKRSAHNNNFCSSITRCTTVVGITMNKEIKMKPTNNTDMAVLVPKRNGSTTTAESTILRGSSTHQVESPHNERYQHSNKNNYKEEHRASSYADSDNKQKSEGQQEEHADEEDKKSDAGDVAQNHDDDGCLLPPHVITSNKRRKMTMNNSQTNASSTTTTGKASRTETAPPFVISGAPSDPFRNTSNTSATNSTAGTQQEEQQINDKNNRNGNRNGSSIGNDNISISNNNKDTAAPASHDYQHYLRYLNHSIIKQSNNLSAKNNENEEYDPPGIKTHSAPTSTMGIDVINFEQEGTREDMYTKQSELKRCREKKRRQNISVAIEKLANTLTKVDPSNLIWHNNKVYFDGHTSFPSSGRERARYGGASFLKNQPLNRTEIINHTIRLVEKFALENEKGKLAVCQLQYRLSRNDSRMSSTRRGAMGDCLLSSRAISYQGLNDELMSNLLLPHHQYNHPREAIPSTHITPNILLSSLQQRLFHLPFDQQNGLQQQQHLLSSPSSSLRQYGHTSTAMAAAALFPYYSSSLPSTGASSTASNRFDSGHHDELLLNHLDHQQQSDSKKKMYPKKKGYHSNDCVYLSDQNEGGK